MKNSLTLKVTTLAVLTLCFSFLTGGSLVLKNLESVLTSWGQDLQMTIYLNPNQTEEERSQIHKKISQYIAVENVSYVTRESALEKFRSQMAAYAPDLLKDEELVEMIPASLQVKFKTEFQGPEQLQIMEQIQKDLKNEKGIDEISFGQDWVKKYTQITGFFRGLVGILGFALGGAALFVISNVIQTSIRQRRAEIEVLELLGATASMIRKPFLIEGATIGALAMVLSLGLNWGLLEFILTHFSVPLSLLKMRDTIHFLSLKQLSMFLLLGPLLGLLASYFCLRRINTGWAAARRRN